MSLSFLMQGLGSVGIFASRAFLPAFATALALRFGPELGGIGHLGLFARVRDAPTWFTSDPCLIALGILSALEMVAERTPEFREVFHSWVHTLKAAMAALTYLGMLKASDRALIDPVIQQAGLAESLPAAFVGGLTFVASVARADAFRLLAPIGDHDFLGIGRIGRWFEDAWSLLGPWLLLLFPLGTLVLLGIATVTFGRLRRRAIRRDAASKVACEGCGRAIFSSALACPGCGLEVERPHAVGWLGGATDRPTSDRESQPFDLFAAGRCPTCAGHLGRRASCPDCGRRPLAEPGFADRYLAFLDRRVAPASVACLAVGLVPVVGAIAGVMACQVVVVGPLRRYLPGGRNLAARWAVRVASLGLIAFQWVPLLGALTLPAVVWINHAVYRKAFTKIAREPVSSIDPITSS